MTAKNNEYWAVAKHIDLIIVLLIYFIFNFTTLTLPWVFLYQGVENYVKDMSQFHFISQLLISLMCAVLSIISVTTSNFIKNKLHWLSITNEVIFFILHSFCIFYIIFVNYNGFTQFVIDELQIDNKNLRVWKFIIYISIISCFTYILYKFYDITKNTYVVKDKDFQNFFWKYGIITFVILLIFENFVIYALP